MEIVNARKHTRRKQLLLILFLGVLIVGCVISIKFVFVKKESLTVSPSPTPTPEQETPTMMLSFSPNMLTISQNGSFQSNITFDTLGNATNGISVVVSYDPTQIENVRLTPVKDPNSALSSSLNMIAGTPYSDVSKGIVSQTYSIPKSIPAQKGKGIIATFSGTLKKGVTNTVVKIDNTSSASSPTISRVVLGKINLEITK